MEILYGSAKPHPEAFRPESAPAIVGFAGAFAGGHNNSQYEQMLKRKFGPDSVMALPSVSTKYAFKDGLLSRSSFRSNDYYRSLADRAIEQFPNKDTFLIHCHSGGGIEGVAFTSALLENDRFQGQKIKLLFSGVPGFAEKRASALGRTFEFLKQYVDIGLNRAQYQHFELCPPPEEFYEYQKANITPRSRPSGAEVVYHDTSQSRQERRNRFYDNFMRFLSPAERGKITNQIAGLDASIRSVLSSSDKQKAHHIKELMHQRAKLVYNVGGDRFYKEYLANKPEYKLIPKAGFDGTVVGAQYLIRLLAAVANGMEGQLTQLIKQAKQKQKTLEFSFGLFEKDKIGSPDDMPTMQKRLSKANMTDYVTNWLILEGLSHEGVDNSPQGICQAILKMTQR